MKVSVCITTYNEENSISKLLGSLLSQTQKPDEIIIVDSKSEDKTQKIIRHSQKKSKKIKLLAEKCSRAKGRNLAIELARNEIIAMTDAGCIAENDWLKKLTTPFESQATEVVAGFYAMSAENAYQKACRRFLGVYHDEFNQGYLPSTRSIAFKREVWEKVGGFSEKLEGTAEDTMFNYKLVKESVKIVRVKDARVEWEMPKKKKEFFQKIKNYAFGDIKSKILYNPSQGIASHNIKMLSIFLRYFLFIYLFVLSFKGLPYSMLFLTVLIFYSLWAFFKVYRKESDIKVGCYGILNQYISDCAIVSGVMKGLFNG